MSGRIGREGTFLGGLDETAAQRAPDCENLAPKIPYDIHPMSRENGVVPATGDTSRERIITGRELTVWTGLRCVRHGESETRERGGDRDEVAGPDINLVYLPNKSSSHSRLFKQSLGNGASALGQGDAIEASIDQSANARHNGSCLINEPCSNAESAKSGPGTESTFRAGIGTEPLAAHPWTSLSAPVASGEAQPGSKSGSARKGRLPVPRMEVACVQKRLRKLLGLLDKVPLALGVVEPLERALRFGHEWSEDLAWMLSPNCTPKLSAGTAQTSRRGDVAGLPTGSDSGRAGAERGAAEAGKHRPAPPECASGAHAGLVCAAQPTTSTTERRGVDCKTSDEQKGVSVNLVSVPIPYDIHCVML